MSPKKLWIISIILLAVHLFVQYGLYLKTEITDGFSFLLFGIDLMSNLLLVFIVGAALGALAAFIPFRKYPYLEKFKRTFPLSTAVLLVVLIAVFSISIYMKKEKVGGLSVLQKSEDHHHFNLREF